MHSAAPTLALDQPRGRQQARSPPLSGLLCRRRCAVLAAVACSGGGARGQLAHGMQANLIQRGWVLALQQLQAGG